MNKTPVTVIVALLAAVVGAAIALLITHKDIPTTKNLDDAFYAFVVKEPHTVPNTTDFKDALNAVQKNSGDDMKTSYCFDLEGESKPLEYGPQGDTPCAPSEPRMPALTHRIYAVSESDIEKVASQIDGNVTPTPTPTP
jgi:hypothetical protein